MMPIGLLLWMKRKRSSFKPQKGVRGIRLAGAVRVIAYAAVAGTFVGALSLHSARADMAESSFAVGHQLLPMSDLLRENHQFVMNGQPVFVSSGTTTSSMKAVLDRFEANCRANNPAFSDVWKEIPKLDKAATVDHHTLPDLGVVRQERAHEGVVVCLTRDESQKGFMGSMREFTKTKDLSKLGQLRYAYVTEQKQGAFVLTAWTDGPFDLGKLVPQKGADAAGADSPDYPRPPSSQRFLSANMSRTPYGVHIYRSAAEPKAVVDFYDQQMDQRGWTIVAPPTMNDFGRVFMKENVQITLATGKDKEGQTIVSFAEMGVAPERGVLPQTVE